jgi:hypothetical protein
MCYFFNEDLFIGSHLKNKVGDPQYSCRMDSDRNWPYRKQFGLSSLQMKMILQYPKNGICCIKTAG